ncbi:MAG: hypothetical protein Q4D41_12425 [Prevotellaceae bacterium]|nr:hypothetical protein [Prevotellaceae bacterium]
MNKKLKLFSFALAALALGACSSEDAIVDSNDGKGFAENGKGYVAVTINLPTRSASSTRTNENDQTSDGKASEYEIKNATLLLFTGSASGTEASAEFKAAYDLDITQTTPTDKDDDQITTQVSKVKEINSLSASKIYALVVLNHNNIFTINADNTINIGTSPTAFSGTFAQFTALTVSSAEAMTTNGIYMANAPVVSTAGTVYGGEVTILKEVTDNIYKTEAQALANTAADIIVERGVAKIELTQNSSSNTTLPVGDKTLPFEITSWVVANKNTSSFIVRNWNQSPVNQETFYGDSWLNLMSVKCTQKVGHKTW